MITNLKNQGGYKESYFKRMSYNDIRPIFERVWDHVNTFIPIGSKVEKRYSKPSKRETSKTVEEEKVEKEDVKPPQANNGLRKSKNRIIDVKAYKAKKEKELGMLQCRELAFLMIDPSSLPPAKRAIIETKQAEIMRKYPNANPNAAP
ncbi:hypothetical protein Tco_1280476 [Tanacetum coccineum]